MSLFTVKNIDKQTDALLLSLPGGKVFSRKFDRNSHLYKFWRSISLSCYLAEQNINRMFDEIDAKTTNELISDWETEYGIPDGIFNGGGTIEDRRRDITAKLSANNIITRKNLIDFFTNIGYTVDIQSSICAFGFPITFPYIFGAGERLNRFIILVRFQEEYENLDKLKEFLQKIIPANVKVFFSVGA